MQVPFLSMFLCVAVSLVKSCSRIQTLLKVSKFLFSTHLLRNDAATFWYLSLYLTEQTIKIHATFLHNYSKVHSFGKQCFARFSVRNTVLNTNGFSYFVTIM